MKISRGPHAGRDIKDVNTVALQTILSRLHATRDNSVLALRDAIVQELKYRGIGTNEVRLTWHAIDRLTQRGGTTWYLENKGDHEGLIHFIRRHALDIRHQYLQRHSVQEGEIVEVTNADNIVWCFKILNGQWVLRTIYPYSGRPRSDHV